MMCKSFQTKQFVELNLKTKKMKKVMLILAVCMTTLTYAGKTFTSAVEYNNFLVGHFNAAYNNYQEVLNVMVKDYTNTEGIWGAHKYLVNECGNSIKEIKDATVYSNGSELKDACLEALKMYQDFAKKDLIEIIKLYTKEDITQADVDKVGDLLDMFELQDAIALVKFNKIQKDYANDNGFTLKSNEANS